MTPDDREFLEAFEACKLGKTCWTHEAHLRMAWLQLGHFGGYRAALDRICAGIKRYNSTQGNPGYHETVTVAFTKLIHYRRAKGDPSVGWSQFLELNPDLLAKSPPILDRYYRRETLAAERAREVFVEPDLRPLPAVGTIRMASPADARDILEIYAPYVLNTVISFEVKPPSLEEMEGRIRETLKIAPWLVYRVDDRVAGYAYGGKHRAREAYRWSADVSVYVREEFRNQGIGPLLYRELFHRLREQGYFNVFAGVTLPNERSVRLHESMGFTLVGIYRNVGYKRGEWHDAGWWQKSLREPGSPPDEIKSPEAFSQI